MSNNFCSALCLAGYVILIYEAFEALPDEVLFQTLHLYANAEYPMRVGQAHMAYTLVDRQGFVPYQSLWELGFLGGEYVAEPRYLAQ